jgi:oxygen-independent coproporphyrinogen-3 oxidase
MLQSLVKEMALRQHELGDVKIETIYFGGGTPSLLTTEDITKLIQEVQYYFNVIATPEITLEANPDDLSDSVIQALAASPVNRLSIGVQSFFERDLKLMNRAHNAEEAQRCLKTARLYFKNISVDLIYGIPGLTKDEWLENIETVLQYDIPHVSCYALTVEPKTALETFIRKGVIPPISDALAQEQFEILNTVLDANGFVNYELSNFGKPNFFSKNNSAYWQGKSYLGIGPSAHSFNGDQRSWNVSNNTTYIKQIQQGLLPLEVETLSVTDKFNEYVMTGLRTIWGVNLERIAQDFGPLYKDYLLEQAEVYINTHLLYIDDATLLTTKKGKFLSDGIASNLFKINLS